MNHVASNTDGDIHADFKYILYIGKGFGLLPSLLAEKHSRCFRIILWTFSIVVMLFCGLHLFVMAHQHLIRDRWTDISKSATAFEEFLFFSTVAIFDVYMLLRGKCFNSLLLKWNLCISRLRFKEPDDKLFLHANITALVVMLGGICENMLYNLAAVYHYMLNNEENKNAKWLELLYLSGYNHFAVIIPYHWLTASMTCLSEKLIVYIWNYMDLLIIVFCRALYYRFKALANRINLLYSVERLLSPNITPKSLAFDEMFSLDDVHSDFVILNNLVDLVNNFFHPIVFLSYSTSVYNICLALHYWIVPHGISSTAQKLFISMSCFQYASRALLITYFASNVNIWAHRVVYNLQNCPNSQYTVSVERMERMVILKPIQIHGMGLFTITRKLLLSILSFMFTFEIIMLQTMSPAVAPGGGTSKSKSK